MNENSRDSQLLISEADVLINQEADFDSSSELNKKGSDLLPSNSNSLRKNLKEDYKKVPTQEFEEIQKRHLPSSSSDEIILDPNLICEQETELKEAKKKKIHEFLKLNVKKFLAIYCEVTPLACLLRERWVFLLSVFICSKIALETKRTEKLAPQLFLASYCCLGLQMIENLLLYRKVANSRAQKVEALFDLADKALLAFVIFLLDLQHDKRINEWFMVLSPLLYLLEIQMYRKHCLIAQCQEDDKKVVWRVFCLFQTAMIAAKVTKIINFKWKETLVFMWSYAGIHALYAPFAFLLLVVVSLTAIRDRDVRTLRLLRSRIPGYIWNICFNLLNAAGVVIVFGFSAKIDSKEDDTFRSGLAFSKNLSSLLVIYLALLFPILKKSNFNLFQDLGVTFQSQVARVVSRKKYNLVNTENQSKRAFFLMISPTYFSQLTDVSQSQFEEMAQKNDIENPQTKEEENLCYICENHVSNAILAECGHGGVCCECVVKLIDKKNECMECRKAAKAIYKIENESTSKPQEVIIQAHEVVEIVEI